MDRENILERLAATALEGGLICEMNGVRGGDTGYAVELWRTNEGQLVVRAYNEAGYSRTEIDLADLLSWLADRPELPLDDLPASSSDRG